MGGKRITLAKLTAMAALVITTWFGAGAAAVAVATNEATAAIAGIVFEDGSPRAEVQADLFADGREVFLESKTTGVDGSYRFDVEPGCYAVTLVAPDGFRFANAPFTNTVPYRSYTVCVAAGEVADLGRDNLIRDVPSPGLFIEVKTEDRGGAPIEAIVIDLFASRDGEERGQYLRSIETDADGNGAFSPALALGCYVVTYIAPDGESFVESGSQWHSLGRCAVGGPTVWSSSATLDRAGPSEDGIAGGEVSDGGDPVDGLVVDLFTATADGGRGTFLADATTGSDGRYQFTVSPGCYVLTLIAPPGRSFVDTSTQWTNRPFCAKAGEAVTDIDAALLPAA